ncbi:Uncharacterised protein [Enterobacter cloacae]|uniref:Uncharacterized protein n=1 Tax=Enterobacter cloacae TaxID=550 RepID=A0A377M648_ENTCL|nr:Uncharacterised protein [Enterobacter cloacae]
MTRRHDGANNGSVHANPNFKQVVFVMTNNATVNQNMLSNGINNGVITNGGNKLLLGERMMTNN